MYSLLTAKCISINWLLYVFQGHNPIVLLSIQFGVRLIEVINNRNKPNTIYFSVRVRLTEVSSE